MTLLQLITQRFNACMAIGLCTIVALCLPVSAQEVAKKLPAGEVPARVIVADSTKITSDNPITLPRRDRQKVELPDNEKTTASSDFIEIVNLAGDTVRFAADDSVQLRIYSAEILEMQKQQRADSITLADYGKKKVYKFNPTRAVWLSALLPGLGQVYNRRYWKLPIVVGGFIGFAYATSWNNRMLTDYTKAYQDITDNDPATNSYMSFYPPTVQESDIDRNWLEKTLKSRKTYFRRNRDLCIFGLVAMYALCVIDAYVDASLSAFEVSDDLSMKVKPTIIEPAKINGSQLPSVGLQCAIQF